MDISLLISSALQYGVLLSILLAIVMLGSFAIAPDMWVGDYPPDVRQKYGAMSDIGRRYRPLIAILFFGTVIVVVALSFIALRETNPIDPNFLHYFLTAFLVLMVFHVFDLLIADWLVFVAIQPNWIVLPGTVGMAGYKDYGFHFRGFLVGIVFSAAAAAVLSGIAYGLWEVFI